MKRNTIIQAAKRDGNVIPLNDAVIESVRIWLQHAETGDKLGIVIGESGSPMRLTEGPSHE